MKRLNEGNITLLNQMFLKAIYRNTHTLRDAARDDLIASGGVFFDAAAVK